MTARRHLTADEVIAAVRATCPDGAELITVEQLLTRWPPPNRADRARQDAANALAFAAGLEAGAAGLPKIEPSGLSDREAYHWRIGHDSGSNPEIPC